MITKIKHFLLAAAFITYLPFASFSQGTSQKKETPHNWHELDKSETGYYGISLDKAYQFLKSKKSKTVVVAVIDSGVDTTQEDLRPVLWHNPGEIPGNGIDDDHNGYVDDVYGWNFIGGKDGRNVKQDSYEGARVYWKLKEKYGDEIPDTANLTGDKKAEAIEYLRAKEKIAGNIDPKELLFMKRILPVLEKGDSIIAKDLGKTEFSGNDLKSYDAKEMESKTAASIYLNIAKINDNYDITNQDVLDDLKGQIRKGESATTPPENYRGEIVKDNENDINDRYYG
ncbi:MAG: S8 family serine peptidase, partial [Bacteroidota bacterium]|nr:S8 family serine peptidase [Bacteroidota bacterium]